jgi:hypothetical protein
LFRAGGGGTSDENRRWCAGWKPALERWVKTGIKTPAKNRRWNAG